MQNTEQDWDLILTSKKSWFDLQLKQIYQKVIHYNNKLECLKK